MVKSLFIVPPARQTHTSFVTVGKCLQGIERNIQTSNIQPSVLIDDSRLTNVMNIIPTM